MTEAIERVKKLPIWKTAVTPMRLTGGLSNESFKVEDQGEAFVVRIGRDFPFHHVSRKREADIAKAAHAAGFAPEVIHCEDGLMVCRFITARTYEAGDVQGNITRIAKQVRDFHNTMPHHVFGTATIFWVFHVIRDYAQTLRAGESRMKDKLAGYLALSGELEKAQIPLPIIFGHHDLLPGNFLDDGNKVWLIDFEYGGYGTAMFDLAGIASNAEFSHEQAEQLLADYFGTKPDQAMLKSHSAMQCASLLREAMWSMVSELYLDTPGVDFIAYTQENLDRLDAALELYHSRFGKA